MLIRHPPDLKPSEITPHDVYLNRRSFLALGAAAALAPNMAMAGEPLPGPFSTDEARTPYDDVTSYNNFYELGPDKADPKRNAKALKTRPWAVTVSGECAASGTYGVEDLIRAGTLEERIYRLRCVEGWSMVIPWIGIPLATVLKRFEPNSNARYVAFQTVMAPDQLPGQRLSLLSWPYVEGLRIDEAMHPLSLLAVGLYGEVLPNQNGAPLRLVVPWKYGFKSIKSIVAITFTRDQPPTSWNRAAPNEYGFYSNVNPEVDHPRWSQAKERRLGEFLRRKTLPFNGYGEQVASLYAGMDLRKDF